MPDRVAISLLLLLLLRQGGVSAFQALQPNNGAPPQQRISSALHTSASPPLDSIPALESILDDGRGHINSNLASAIYEWEMAQKGSKNYSDVKKQQFSTRDGLRLVDALARETLSSLSDDSAASVAGGRSSRKSGVSYNDLVQEGIVALLRAMSTYDNYKSHNANSSAGLDTVPKLLATFEEYATQSIRSSFLNFLAHSSRPIRLPLRLQTTLQNANVAAEKLRNQLGKEPTLIQVAKEIKIAPEQLALYRKLYRTMVSRVGTFVSVEDGMEVYDPTLAGVGVGTGLRARSDSERSGAVGTDAENASGEGGGGDEYGFVLSGGKMVRGGATPGNGDRGEQETLANSNERELIQLNSQEDDWEREPPERIVAPLRDVLTDTEEINNPLSYTHHYLLNEELNSFLIETLTEEELTVIQLRFGLLDSKYHGRGWTANEIGERMGMAHEDVIRVASAALEKLRKAAPSANYWEEDSDAHVEVSL